MSVNFEDSDNTKQCCSHLKKSSSLKCIVLLLILIGNFLYAVNYDMPGAMSNVIQATFNVTAHEYEYTYSVYGFPNIVCGFVSGLLIDRVFGLFISSLIFCAFTMIGQVIVTLGGFTFKFWLVLAGRFINGMGSESVCLSINCFAVLWFKGNKLGFVFGLLTSVTRLGSSFNFFMYPPVYEKVRSVFSGKLLLGISILPYLGFLLLLTISMVTLGFLTRFDGRYRVNSDISEDRIKFKQLLEFPVIFWPVLLMVTLSNTSLYGFVSISQSLLQSKYRLNEDYASTLSGVFSLLIAVGSPVFGVVIYKTGRDIYFLLISTILGVVSLTIMSCTMWNVWIPLTMYSISCSVFCCCGSPLISSSVRPYQLASAFGLTFCFMNLFLTGYNVLIGFSIDKYGPVGAALVILAPLIISLICVILIWYLDRRANGSLNYSANRRQNLEEKKTEDQYQ